MSAAKSAARETLVHEVAVRVGQRWFEAWREDLRRQGRRIEGGWPGTLGEARALLAASLVPELKQLDMSSPTDEELRREVRTTYEEARRAWRTSSEWRRSDPE